MTQQLSHNNFSMSASRVEREEKERGRRERKRGREGKLGCCNFDLANFVGSVVSHQFKEKERGNILYLSFLTKKFDGCD